MTKAAPPEAGAAAEKKRPLLRRVPTSLIVTLVGIALTAWLLPAFTHQWDDRQKAQALRTALVGEMAAATARALVGGEAIWSGQHVDRRELLAAWSVSSLQLEARLRAYFGGGLVREWEIYTWLVTRYDDAHTGASEGALLAATTPKINLPPRASSAIALVFHIGDNQKAFNGRVRGPDFSRTPTPTLEWQALYELRQYLKPYQTTYASSGGVGLTAGPHTAEFALLTVQSEMAREILHSHVTGYSTTGRDLLHDLVP